MLLSFPFVLIGFFTLFIAAGYYYNEFIDEWMITATVSLLFFFLGAHLLSIGIIGELFVETGDYSPKKNVDPTVIVF